MYRKICIANEQKHIFLISVSSSLQYGVIPIGSKVLAALQIRSAML